MRTEGPGRSAQGSVAVACLCEQLEPDLAAYIAETPEPTVGSWINGAERPPASIAERLDLALSTVKLIAEQHSLEVAQDWFTEPNNVLDGATPAGTLRNIPLDDARPAILAAALHFATDFDL